MAQFKFKRMSRQVGLRCCGACQFFPPAQFLLDAFRCLPQHLGLCERTRVVSRGRGSPWVSFSTHFTFLLGSNILGSIAGSPQALGKNFQLFDRKLFYSRRSRFVHNFQLSGAKKPCFQLCQLAHGILLEDKRTPRLVEEARSSADVDAEAGPRAMLSVPFDTVPVHGKSPSSIFG